MFWKKSFPTPAASMVFEQGIMTTPFVSPWSTMTINESNPLAGGRSVTRSTDSCLNSREKEEEMGFRGAHIR